MLKFLIRIAVVAGLAAMAVYGARRSMPEALPIAVLVAGVAAARYFARDLVDAIPALARLARRRALEPWNGRYYAFDGRQIRLYLADGAVWIAEADLKDILVPPATAQERRQMGVDGMTIPGTGTPGFPEAGLLRMLAVRNANRGGRRELVRFAHWLESEALPNIKRLPSSSTVQR